MTPHPENFDGAKSFNYLIDKAMLNVYSPGACARKIPNKLFEGRR